MGHAGAIVGGSDDTAQAKKEILTKCGINVVNSPADIGKEVIIFNANYNSALAPNLGQFFTNGFDVNLYTTTGVSGPSNTFINGITGASFPSFTFDNLADGWYVVEASPAGWNCPTIGPRSFDELPIEAQNYIRKIEELSQLPVDILSTGPDRDETLIIQNPFD